MHVGMYIRKIIFCIHVYVSIDQHIGPVGRVFANGLKHLGSIPDRVIRKTLKIVLDTS